MPRRRRKKVSVVDHPAQHVVSKQPVIVHGVADIRRGQSSRTVDGRVVQEPVDLFVRQPGPAPRPQPRMPIDLRQMQHELGARIRKDLAQSRVEFRELKKPKFKSKAGAVWQFVKGGKFYKHPFRALRAVGTLREGSVWNAIFSSKEAGVRNYLREKRQYKTVTTLREKHRLQERLNDASERFGKRMNTIFTKMQSDVNSGRANPENVRGYLERYENALKRTEIKLTKEINRILGSHMRPKEESHFTDFKKAGPKARLLPKDLRKAA